MTTVTRTIALIVEMGQGFDEGRFAEELAKKDPQNVMCHGDGRVARGTWYHFNQGYFKTIFSSYRRPLWESSTPRSCYIHPSCHDGQRVAVGTYMGEPGEWHLYRCDSNGGRAPYEL